MTAADPTDMAHSLTRQNLHGIWVAIATPFDEDYCLDEAALRENIRRCTRPVFTASTPPTRTASSMPSNWTSSSALSTSLLTRPSASVSRRW